MRRLKFYLWDVWTFQSRLYIYGGLLLIIIIGGVISNCKGRRAEQKIEQLNENITTGKVEANVLTNQKANIQIEVNNAANQSNNSIGNFHNSLFIDSANYSGANAGKRFCEKYPFDKSCQ